MVRAVRNWWIEVDIDGRQTRLEGGPQNKFGGFTLRIYQRDDGQITEAARLFGKAPEFSTINAPGTLILEGSVNGIHVKNVTRR